MRQDHFTGCGFDRNLWAYYNMGSPCYQVPERVGDSELKLYEYDRYNQGNCLVSRAFLARNAKITARITGVEDPTNGGAAIGFYAGDGSFSKYVLLEVGSDGLMIQVPSGGQRGASFMDGGQPQLFELASMDYVPQYPLELALSREGTRYVAYVNGREMLRCDAYEIDGDARAVIKARGRKGERYTPLYTLFDWASFEGEAPTTTLTGRVLGPRGCGIAGASVHVAGFDDHFTLTDADGHFHLCGLPRGEVTVIAAAEGYLFAQSQIGLASGAANCMDLCLVAETEANIPRREYNSPYFDRSMNGWKSLNGTWQFMFDPDNVGEVEQWYRPDARQLDKAIRVPFSWASLMGFGEEQSACGDTTHEANSCMNNFNITGPYAWYRRSFSVPDSFVKGDHVVLHIGASSAVTYVWVDGRYQGGRIDEYSDLAFDLGSLEPGSEHTLAVKVEYPHDVNAHNMGKQIFWFSSAPGIWQSVWIEPRKPAHIDKVLLRPELTFEKGNCQTAQVIVHAKAIQAEGMTLRLTFTGPDGSEAAPLDGVIGADGAMCAIAGIANPVLWDYLAGNLYTVDCELLDGQARMDRMRTYVGLRKVERRWLPGHSPSETADPMDQYQYVFLNDRPFYIIGILDQGYNAFGIYTYRSLGKEGPEGLRGSIVYDVDRTLAYGYNLSRVHIKENEPLWYHECDRRGLPVWTEHPSNFFALPENPDWQRAYDREMDGMMQRLHNAPSVIIVSSINESWGIEGRHVSSPWKNELRYRFMVDAAERARSLCPHMLICDNSGFGKTNAGDLNDFHYYPNDHFQAREKWREMLSACYPGSIFNHINAAHGEGHIGEAVQQGKPILISEFLHINGIDLQTRMFEKIAGYLRMNVASHEVENSGPLTSDRFERDYGYVDRYMRPQRYNFVNNMDCVVADMNRITHLEAGSKCEMDIYVSHFGHDTVADAQLHFTFTGIDALGNYREHLNASYIAIECPQYRVEKVHYTFEAPRDLRGGYLFFHVEAVGKLLCQNYIQFVFDGAELSFGDGALSIPPSSYAFLRYDRYGGCYQNGEASLVYIVSKGSVSYDVEIEASSESGILVFEAGAREGVAAIKVTDEVLFPTEIDVVLDGQVVGHVSPKDDPSDERALFMNDTLSGQPYNYRNTGRFGYGERFEVELPSALLTPGQHELRFDCGEGGMNLYGANTGRYGFNPTILLK